MVQVTDICSARKKLGLSQEQLAEALGVSRNTIGRWKAISMLVPCGQAGAGLVYGKSTEE